MDGNDLDGQLLARYLSGDCTPEEQAVVRDWMLESKEHREFLEDVQDIWVASDESADEGFEEQVDVDSDWGRLRSRIEAAEDHDRRLESVRPRRPRSGREQASAIVSPPGQLMRVAAVVALLVVGAVVVSQYWGTSAGGTSAGATAQKIITEPGQRATVRLGDGTRVTLNVESQLEVPPSFNQTTRTVELQGEAYFDVVEASDQPFVIRSGNARVEVLGTKFGVQSYSSDRVSVVVEEGSVVMASRSSPQVPEVQLGTGEMGQLTDPASRIDVSTTNIEDYLGWRNGQLVFRETRLSEVVSTLERWYNIEGEIQEESLRDLRLTARLKSQSLSDVLSVIAVSLGIE